MNGTDEKTEIVEDLPVDQIINEAFIQKFEKQAELYQKRYLPICLKLTNEADWVCRSSWGKVSYSLQCSGAEKLCNPLGINWDRPVVTKHERKDDQGDYYEYEVEGIIKCGVLKRWGWFTGNCDSRDAFFVSRGNFAEGDIRKAAFSNWLVNAVTRLAGIRNPTSELLQQAGLDISKVQGIDYSGAGKTPEEAAGIISDSQRKRLFAMSRQHNWRDEQVIELINRKPWGYTSTKDIQRKHYDAICTLIEKGPNRTPGEEG